MPAVVARATGADRGELDVPHWGSIESEAVASRPLSETEGLALLGRQRPTAENQLGRLGGRKTSEGGIECRLVGSMMHFNSC
jgi:hypothetical protein